MAFVIVPTAVLIAYVAAGVVLWSGQGLVTALLVLSVGGTLLVFALLLGALGVSYLRRHFHAQGETHETRTA